MHFEMFQTVSMILTTRERSFMKAIFPAGIRHTKSASSRLKLLFKYETKTEAKLLAYGPGVVQEVFVVTNNVKVLKEKLSKS